MWLSTFIVVFVTVFIDHIVRGASNAGGAGGTANIIRLNDGNVIPQLGLGTWLGRGSGQNVSEDAVEKAVSWAIDAGYRHIDTAFIYHTEEQVGRAVNKKIADGIIKREDVFITTKLWNDKHARAAVVPALKDSLQKLNLTYVDLYLIHWPISENAKGELDNTSFLETWQGMIDARKQGLAHSIGVSNFNVQMLEKLIAESDVRPANLQVEFNLNLQQPALLQFCRDHNISVTAYTPFGSLFPQKAKANAPPPRADDEALVGIAKKHNKTVPQIALRYLVELGVIPIPKSLTQSRIEQNIAVFDFQLSQEEKDLLKSYDRGYRTIEPSFWKKSPFYPF